MKPRTLVSFVWIGLCCLVVAHPFAGQSTNQDFVNLTWAMRAYWCHWLCPVCSIGLLVWWLLGDKLGQSHRHKGGGGGGSGE